MVASVVKLEESRTSPSDTLLGPARVVSLAASVLEVELPTGERRDAALAFPIPVALAAGDTVLVIGQGEALYAIGVIRAEGAARVSVEGDLDLHARGGVLTLHGDRGVTLRGPALEVLVERFSVLADAAVQKFTTLHQRVKDMLTLHAGESHTIVDETSLQRARKVALIAEETASVNGKQILLG
jgi:hypothetical protein